MTSSKNRLSGHAGVAALMAACLASNQPAQAASLAPAAEPMVRQVVADPSGYGGQLALPVGGSRVLRFDQPIGRVLVGEPKVGDVVLLGDRSLYVLGKAPGATSLTVLARGPTVRPLATMDLRVGYDVDGVTRALTDILPGEAVQVAARGDGVVLTGTVSSSAAAARAAAVAEQYAAGHVVNLTSVRGAEQVMLSVRVAEVQRSALQQLGLNNINAVWDSTHAIALAPGVINQDAVANLLGRNAGGNWTVQALFDALERKGYASTLAEPNLVALSGETAVFFAGGEFPIPVPQQGGGGNNTITIEYKQYGVSIGFTPTVSGDTINLLVAPEVSALDPANSVVLQGFRIPGLTTRRAKTTIELRNGQSFAIAGLIRREYSDSLRGLPGASSLPVFGSLFRSTGYQNDETEVMIIVTAQLAKPTDRRNLLLPTDLRQSPNAAELYLNNETDRPLPPAGPSASLAAPTNLALNAAPERPAAAPASAPAHPVVPSVSLAAAPVAPPAPVTATPSPSIAVAPPTPLASLSPVTAVSVAATPPAPKPAPAASAAAATQPPAHAATANLIASNPPAKPAPVAPTPATPVSVAVAQPLPGSHTATAEVLNGEWLVKPVSVTTQARALKLTPTAYAVSTPALSLPTGMVAISGPAKPVAATAAIPVSDPKVGGSASSIAATASATSASR